MAQRVVSVLGRECPLQQRFAGSPCMRDPRHWMDGFGAFDSAYALDAHEHSYWCPPGGALLQELLQLVQKGEHQPFPLHCRHYHRLGGDRWRSSRRLQYIPIPWGWNIVPVKADTSRVDVIVDTFTADPTLLPADPEGEYYATLLDALSANEMRTRVFITTPNRIQHITLLKQVLTEKEMEVSVKCV
ncbi:hypothetical protein B0H11DRAFT_2217140 [Mycena galericulata]|nr:hypothetical protein B0H11DRAFT_2217140 [Mycena galericulata]